MRETAVLLVLLAASLTSAEFLVSDGHMGKNVSILCEGERAVFISGPSGNTVQLRLGGGSQASFVPRAAGPYAIQCGNETKMLHVPHEPVPVALAQREWEEADAFVLYIVTVAVLILLAAGFLAMKYLIIDSTLFSKTVEGNRARILLHSGRDLKNLTISDPVRMGFGREMKYSVQSLGKGREWMLEYEIDEPEKALPASLEAEEKGKKVALISELFIVDGTTQKTGQGGKEEKGGKKVPKASG